MAAKDKELMNVMGSWDRQLIRGHSGIGERTNTGTVQMFCHRASLKSKTNLLPYYPVYSFHICHDCCPVSPALQVQDDPNSAYSGRSLGFIPFLHDHIMSLCLDHFVMNALESFALLAAPLHTHGKTSHQYLPSVFLPIPLSSEGNHTILLTLPN